ncbi:MAG: VWA-like domain-containing protein [Planctomycetota bacterium]
MSWQQRISKIVQAWSLSEPLLFAAWSMHELRADESTPNIRVGRGKVYVRPDFIKSLRQSELRTLLKFEAMRILFGHPYSRRRPRADLAYTASNLTVQEYLRTDLPIPRPRECFDDPGMDSLYFERYYNELLGRETHDPTPRSDKLPDSSGGGPDDEPSDAPEGGGASGEADDEADADAGDGAAEIDGGQNDGNANDNGGTDSGQATSSQPSPLEQHADAGTSADANTLDWDEDDLTRQEIHAAIREAEASEGWGTIRGSMRERLLADLHPKLDYRGVLRRFRQNILSHHRVLTRMRPSRRYGFWQLGSRREYTTRVLLAIDISGSMSSNQVRAGISTIRPFLRQGIESIDVVFFDTEVQADAVTLRRAAREFEIVGRGGTNFDAVTDYVDAHPDYDGIIIYTDGFAPAPRRCQNSRAQWLWLFDSEQNYRKMSECLSSHGTAAFLNAGGDSGVHQG